MISRQLFCAVLAALLSTMGAEQTFAQDSMGQVPPSSPLNGGALTPVPPIDGADLAAPETPLAREDRLSAETATLLSEVDREVEAMLQGRVFITPDTRPLLFTPFQMGLLTQLRQALKESPPVPAVPPQVTVENMVVEDAKDLEPEVLPPTVRVLALGGIMMQSDTDWTVWFNGQRLKPGRLPPEIKEIRVTRDFVDMIWLDKTSNSFVPVRLRPNQRFNLDKRLFLSGSEPETDSEGAP